MQFGKKKCNCLLFVTAPNAPEFLLAGTKMVAQCHFYLIWVIYLISEKYLTHAAVFKKG